MKNILKILIGFVTVVILVALLDYEAKNITNNIKAEKGIVDLRNWNFSEHGIINLGGEWETYDNQLLTPDDFKDESKTKDLTGYTNLNSTSVDNKNNSIKPNGIRTYRITLNLKKSEDIFGLKIDNIKMSNKVFVNEQMVSSSGNPAPKNEGYKMGMVPQTAYFQVKGDKVEIILNVANFDYPFNGKAYKIYFGSEKDISIMTSFNFGIEIAAALCTFFIGMYYLGMYSANKRNKADLYYGLNLIAMALVVCVVGQKILAYVFPWIPFEFFIKLRQFGYISFILSFVGIANELNKNILKRIEFKTAQIVTALYTVTIMLTGYSFSVYVDLLFILPVLSFIVLMLVRLVLDVIRTKTKTLERKENITFIFCILSVIIHGLSNNLSVFNITSTKIVSYVSIAIYMMFLSYILINRYFIYYTKAEKMTENLIRADRIKNEFIAKTSYELKAPLYGIATIAENIIKEKNYNLCEKNIDDIAMIESMALRLDSIINNTLDSTLIRNNQLKVNTSSVDIMVCANLVIDGFENRIRDRDIEIINNIRETVMVKGDKIKIGQILFNIINNSIQNMIKGKIEINIEQKNDKVYISIEDTGCGIPSNKVENIFNPYKFEGSNITSFGLHISKELAGLMGGDIYLDWTEQGRGSRFIVSFIYSQERDEGISKKYYSKIDDLEILKKVIGKNTLDIDKEKSTILIVEDEIENIIVVSNILKEEYNVLTAASKDEVLEKVSNNNIDLVILDLVIPGTSGIDICKNIREKYSIIELPILVSTPSNTSYNLGLALEAGANDFVGKPFEDREVISRIKTLITLKKAMEDAIKSEMAFLQAQIKPHFLYNSLSTIISFCYTDGEKAAKLLIHFSRYLRFASDINNNSMYIPLRKELEVVDAYVQIKKAGLGDRIKIEYDIDPEMMDKRIPALYIQPLVENAICHGLYEKEGDGVVYVVVKRVKGKVHIIVNDNGVGMSKGKVEELNKTNYESSGVGLLNIKKRARRLNEADMNIHSIKGEGTTVSITFKHL